MEKTVIIGGNEVRMKASALIPRLYRFKFGRDVVTDMNHLKESFEAVKGDKDKSLSVMDLTIFENLAYLFVKHADDSVPDTPEEWLDSIDGVFSIYEILPVIFELWQGTQHTTSVPVKK